MRYRPLVMTCLLYGALAAIVQTDDPPLVLDCDTVWSGARVTPIRTRGAPALVNLMVQRARNDCFDLCALSAHQTLGGWGSDAVPALVEKLGEAPEDCGLISISLSIVGPPAVAPLMAVVLNASESVAVQQEAVNALAGVVGLRRRGGLGEIQPPPAIATFAPLLQSPDVKTREMAAEVLVLFGRGREVLQELGAQRAASKCCDPALVTAFRSLCADINTPPNDIETVTPVLRLISSGPSSGVAKEAAKEVLKCLGK